MKNLFKVKIEEYHCVKIHRIYLSCGNLYYLSVSFFPCIFIRAHFHLFWFQLLCESFSSHSKWGLLSSCSVWASHCSGFSCCRAQAQQLWRTGFSCSAACGIFPDQGSNLCLLHWWADSLPLN